MYTLVMRNSVLSIVILMVSFSRWWSFFDGVDSGLRVKWTQLWIKNSKPSPGPRRRSCRTSVLFWMLGLLNCAVSLDS